ncbi:MAG: hypothetical protein H6576_04000 [Lewinellaceae bacterium]|nr:hypothetical protein [Saprospiraceae bacterium]MCB9342830.1 hypothetical protein [Lewinellaceae bacterium]
MSQLLFITLLILSGILAISLINFLTNRKLKKYLKRDSDNVGVNALKAILFICAGLFISEVGAAAKELLNTQSFSTVGNLMIGFIAYFTLFFSISVVVLLLSIWFAKMTFSVLSKGVNIYEAASRNDAEYLLLFSGISICICFITRTGLFPLLISTIQYSETPIFH